MCELSLCMRHRADTGVQVENSDLLELVACWEKLTSKWAVLLCCRLCTICWTKLMKILWGEGMPVIFSMGLPIQFFFLFVLLLEYSRLTMLRQFSGGQQNDSAIHIHVSILPHTPLPTSLPHHIEQCLLCSTGSPCWLSILNIVVCAC